jgi:hypothetical protein
LGTIQQFPEEEPYPGFCSEIVDWLLGHIKHCNLIGAYRAAQTLYSRKILEVNDIVICREDILKKLAADLTQYQVDATIGKIKLLVYQLRALADVTISLDIAMAVNGYDVI